MWMSVAHRSAVVAVAACSALALVSCGGGGGETRRFDQYPTLLGIEGSGVVVAGEKARMLVVADTDFTWNDGLSLDETLGVDQSAAVAVSPARATLTRHGDSYTASAKLTAPQVGSVTRLEIKARNPRTEVARDIYVVPAGTLYVKSLTVAGNLLVGGSSAQATLELSDLVAAGADVEVDLAASNALLSLPAKVVVAAHTKTAVFAISAAALQGEAYVRLTATLNGATQSTGLWLRSAEPFLRYLAVPANIATDPSEPRSTEGTATLSVPLPADATLSLSSNNNLVRVPATVRAEAGQQQVVFAIDSAPFGGSSAVRFTASLGGVQRVADASVGFRPGDARLERLGVDGSSTMRPFARLHGSCVFQLYSTDVYGTSQRRAFVDVTLAEPAPPDTRIEIIASKPLAAAASTEIAVPTGERRASVEMPIWPGAQPGDATRLMHMTARVKSTGQQLSEPIIVVTSRSGAIDLEDVDIESVGPFAPPFVFLGGATTRFAVFLRRAHPYDDVPIRLSLHERGSGALLGVLDTVVFAGTSSRVVAFLLPAVAQATAVELRALLGSPRSDGNWCGPESPRQVFAFDMQAAAAGLADIASSIDGLFAGQSSDVTVRLSQAASRDTRVAITSSLAASVLSGVPTELLIPAGRTAASFTVTAAANTTAVSSGTLTARLAGNTRTANVHVLPEPAALQLSLTPASVSSGQPVTLQVQVTPAYPIPMPVTLMSDRAVLPVPPVLAIGANAGMATTVVNAGPVSASETVTVTARLRGLSATQMTTVSPALAPGHGWSLISPIEGLSSSLVFNLPSVVAEDATGQAFFAYIQTVGTQRRLGVRRENGGLFTPLGDVNANQSWSATSLDMVLDAGGRPVLAYGINSDSMAVSRWDEVARQWQLLSPRLNRSNGAGSSPQIGLVGSVPGQQVIVVAWVEAEQIAVRRYTVSTQSWDAGEVIAGIDHVRSVRLAIDPSSGAPVIAYWSGTLNVISQDALGVWQALGGAVNNQPTDVTGAAHFGVHVDLNNNAGASRLGGVRVAWVEGVPTITGLGPWAIYARSFNGLGWEPAATLTNTTGFVFDAGAGNTRLFPASLVVARNPLVFAFATAWNMVGSGDSDVRVLRLGAGNLHFDENPVPTGSGGTYGRVRHVSLVMRDADRALVTSSHHDPIAAPPFLLQARRFTP